MIRVEQLPLWEVLKSDKVDDAQRGRIKQLIEHAAAILDRVIETFPTYTLHNSTHAVNVVNLMAELLGPRREDLRPLEAALLMLSAFYHDIGMVFREDERNRLTEEPEWKTFLGAKPDAYLAVKKAGEVPIDIAEWYCRWRHADRVYVYLNHLPDERVKWGQTSIREELGEVCRSHNLPASALLKLRTDFRGEADLRFCAVLLRLADILDFDRTRSPEAVYEHLGLSRRIDPRQDASDVEWRKHLCSEGFRFPDERQEAYKLSFVAGPDEPGVEHDVREFLKVIEEEIEQCGALLLSCSNRWRNLPLPIGIDRSNIHGNGYRYGEYRFTLDQGQVMDLLMGENLYEEPYVFVRELIQNALDTSRHRRFIERASGNLGFEPKPIQVRHWIDRDGYQWVRFDDDGMGMHEEIVTRHLLKVGSSYYTTAAFRAEILRAQEKTDEDFVPISRFGIGLLSCFIAGDRVEINTLRWVMGSEVAVPIRLSLNGLHGFFTLQTPHLTALPMPTPNSEEPGYRLGPGTSIAVRLDPTKERRAFEPVALLQQYVACPSVPIELSGKRIGGEPSILVERPWFERTIVTISPCELRPVSEFLGKELQEKVQVDFLPIDLTKHSPIPQLKGQMALVMFRASEEWHRLASELEVSLLGSEAGFAIEIRRRYGKVFLAKVSLPDQQLLQALRCIREHKISWLSHNGTAVPTRADFFPSITHGIGWTRGLISLKDSLCPRLSISREILAGLPWRFYSAAGLSLYRALIALGEDPRSSLWSLFRMAHPEELLLRDLLDDELLQLNGPWAKLPIIQTASGLNSIYDIRDQVAQRPIEIFIPWPENQGYLDKCAATLIQCGLNASIHIETYGKHHRSARILATEGEHSVASGYELFPPLTFLPFSQSSFLRSNLIHVFNSNHPFSAWLIETAPDIAQRYPGMFERIRSEILQGENWRSYLSAARAREQLNAALERLRELHPSVHPPKDLVLKPRDFPGILSNIAP